MVNFRAKTSPLLFRHTKLQFYSFMFYCLSVAVSSYRNRKVEIPDPFTTYIIDHEYERSEEELFPSKEELINDLENCEEDGI